MEILLCALAVLQYLDYYTTRKILAGGGREYNPLIRWLMAELGVDKALILKGLLVMGIGWQLGQQALWGLGILIVGYVGVVAFNWKSLKGGK